MSINAGFLLIEIIITLFLISLLILTISTQTMNIHYAAVQLQHTWLTMLEEINQVELA